jgi:hypothetical protein
MLLGAVREGYRPQRQKITPYLSDDAVLWEIDKLFDDHRGQHLLDGFLRGQLTRLSTQIEPMVLPHQGAKLKRDQLQEAFGNSRAEDKGFIGLPARLDGRQVLRQGGFEVAIKIGSDHAILLIINPLSSNARHFQCLDVNSLNYAL